MSKHSEFRTVRHFAIGDGSIPFVSVIMPVRNEGERLPAVIHSIVGGRSSRFPLQVILVDDCSTDGCCDALGELGCTPWDNVELLLVRLPRWSGIPYARNVGASFACAEILFITDANVRFPQNWDLPIRNRIAPMRALCATIADENSPFRACGGMLHLPAMGFHWLRNPNTFGGYAPLSPCTGTIMPRELFRRVGGYDTGMPVYGAAEPEFSVRLWLSGAEIVCAPELVLKHRFRPTSERRPFLQTISLLQIHNYLRFGFLYLDRNNSKRVFDHYAASAPELVDRALQLVLRGDVWRRRDVLIRTLPLRFESFVKRFGFVDAQGRFSYG